MEKIVISSEWLRNFNEVFRKDVTYDNIKNHKNLSLSRRYVFGKTTGETQNDSLSLLGLTMPSDRTDLYRNVTFSILVLSTKKRFFSFLKLVFLFQKICFKFKALKTLKRCSDCHIKTYLSNGWLFWKSVIPFIEEPMLFLLALKWNF